MNLNDFVKEFNKNHATKAKLISKSEKNIVIEMSGKSETRIEEDMYALRSKLEQSINESILIQKVHKTGNTFKIKFSIEKNPTKEILEILKRYEEGTMPRGGAYED